MNTVDIAPKKSKKFLLYILAFAAIVAISYFAFLYFKGFAAKAQNGQMLGEMPVNVVKLSKQNIDNFEELPARISAAESAEIRPQVDGVILKILFKEGGKVTKGEQLYQVDPAPYEANYNSAKADLEKAKANFAALNAKNKRYEELIKTESVSKQEFDDNKAEMLGAKADVEVARAAMEKQKIYLDYTKVFSPIAGYISKTLVKRGSLVSAGQSQALAIVTQLDPIFVDIQIPSEDLMRFKSQIATQEKVEVEIILNDGSIYPHKGEFQFSEVNVDPDTSAVSLRALFDNTENILLPGSFVKVKIKTSNSDVILIPQKMTSRNPDGNLSVFVVNEQNIITPTIINITREVGNNWIVKDGVKEGDLIVADGFQKIKPSLKVKPILLETK